MSDKQLRGPMMLMDKVFEIPIFNAQGQHYVCTNVECTNNDSTTKTYEVFFKWIPSQFHVPEMMRMDITMFTATPDRIGVELYEKTKSSGLISTKLFEKTLDYKSIQSVTSIQSMIHKLIIPGLKH